MPPNEIKELTLEDFGISTINITTMTHIMLLMEQHTEVKYRLPLAIHGYRIYVTTV